jgi:hypothetical protein
MSDHITTFIPVDPRFVPSKKAQKAAIRLLKELAPSAEDVSSEVDDVVVFRDCGENFERVSCPHCRADIVLEVWQDWMSQDCEEDGGFRLAGVAAPCCKAMTSLDDLAYDWPQGFSRYSLKATNADGLRDDAVAKLEAVLGCKLRRIRQMI